MTETDETRVDDDATRESDEQVQTGTYAVAAELVVRVTGEVDATSSDSANQAIVELAKGVDVTAPEGLTVQETRVRQTAANEVVPQ